MSRRKVSGIILTLLLVCMLALAFNIQQASSELGPIIVPDDYLTVQEDINAANDGDIIFVEKGDYYENIVVNRSVTLIGEDLSKTNIWSESSIGETIRIVANKASPNGFEVQITTDYSASFDSAIDGIYIVYTDIRNGTSDVYLYNILNGTEIPIAATAEDEFLNDVSGEFVVYTIAEFDDDDIYVYHIPTETTTRITDPEDNEFAMRRDPAISGDYVVWQDNRNGGFDIYLYNLSSSIETLISFTTSGHPTPGYQIHPAIHGNIVVWEDVSDPDNPDIYYYDLNWLSIPSASPVKIPADERHKPPVALQAYPDVYERYVVFDEATPDDLANRDIVLWDLDSNQAIWNTTHISRQERARIDGNRVVWEDSRNGNIDVYTYEISSGLEEPIVTEPSMQFLCDISNNRIVWTDLRNVDPKYPSNYDIYMYVLTMPWDITGPIMWVPDGKCDIRDIALVAMLYGSVEGDERYDVRADITGPTYLVPDGKIDIRDIALIAIHYGEVYT